MYHFVAENFESTENFDIKIYFKTKFYDESIVKI